MSSVLMYAESANKKSFSSSSSGSSGTCSDAPVALYLYLNADRNGELTRKDLDLWTWGSKGRGTILVANELNSTDDRCLEVVEIRLEPSDYSGSLVLSGTLNVAEGDASRLRIFLEDLVILDADHSSAMFTVPLNGARFGIEASRFNRSSDDDAITLIFTPSVGGVAGSPQIAILRVAPWILPSHANQAASVFCSTLAKNATFRDDLAKTIDPLPLIDKPFSSSSNKEKPPPPFAQDSMKIGHSYGSDGTVHYAVLRSPASRWDDIFTSGRLEKMPIFKVCQTVEMNNAMDGGNLDVTPPTKQYPLGRIYYSPAAGSGFKIDPALASFLSAQRVQPPFTLDSSWLYVGHVDEMVSFLPTSKGLVACVPSPRKALELLLRAAKVEPAAVMLKERDIVFDEAVKPGESEIGGFLLKNCFSGGYYKANFGSEPRQATTIGKLSFDNVDLSGGCMGQVMNAVQSIREALGEEIAFLEIPVLFTLHHGAAAALTGNMVNMLVLRPGACGACVMQPPAGPILSEDVVVEDLRSLASDFIAIPAMKFPKGQDLFQTYTQAALAAIGWQCGFVDGWKVYHLKHGETHCATQTRRIASTSPQWWSVDPASYRVQTSSGSDKKGKKDEERAWRVVPMPKNNDCFYHAVLFGLDPGSYLEMSKVKELRLKVSNQILVRIYGKGHQGFLSEIEKALAGKKDYLTVTATFEFSSSLVQVKNYNKAKGNRNDDFLGQNVADALFRMRYTNKEIEDGKIPQGVKRGTIWGDSDFAAPEVVDIVEHPIRFYRDEEQPQFLFGIGEDDYGGEKPIRLLISSDGKHFNAIEGNPDQ